MRHVRIPIVAVALTVLAVGASSSALADHRDRGPGVFELAREVERSSRNVYAHAARTVRHPGHGERKALYALDAVGDRARWFRKTLRSYGPDDRHTQRAFSRLSGAVRHARQTLPYLRTGHRLQREYRQVEFLMRDLRSSYRAQLAYARPVPTRYGYSRHGARYGASIRFGKRVGDGYVDIGYGKRGGKNYAYDDESD